MTDNEAAMLQLIKTSARVLAEVSQTEQTPVVLHLRRKLVDMITSLDPGYFGFKS